jgi:hypothetical protein
VITLLKRLRKVVERVAADAIAEQYKRRQLLHDGQFGCRMRWSAIDMVGRLMKKVEEGWSTGNTTAVRLMDVQGAFVHMAKGNLNKGIEQMGFESDLVWWVENCIEERKVIMSTDGKEGDSVYVETVVPQGSLVSRVLFVIYLLELFGRVENEMEHGSEGISFVDDVAWVVEGEDVGECTQRMGRCATEAQIWVKEHACWFDFERTKVILFTRKKNNKKPEMNFKIRVGTHEVQYNKEATRRLGVWLDCILTLNDHTKMIFAKARKLQNRVRSLMVKKGLSPEGCQ